MTHGYFICGSVILMCLAIATIDTFGCKWTTGLHARKQPVSKPLSKLSTYISSWRRRLVSRHQPDSEHMLPRLQRSREVSGSHRTLPHGKSETCYRFQKRTIVLCSSTT